VKDLASISEFWRRLVESLESKQAKVIFLFVKLFFFEIVAFECVHFLDTVFHRTKSTGDQKIHMHVVVAYWVITKWLKFSKSIGGNKFLDNNFHFIGGAFRYLRLFSWFMETISFWMLAEKLCFREFFDNIFLTISKITIAVDQIWVIVQFLHFSL